MKKKVFTVLVTLFLLIVVFVLFGCDNFSLFDVLANEISLIPREITLKLGETVEFKVFSGFSPFVFTEVGDGIIPNGIYTPASENTYIISVQDDRNRTAEAHVTVVDAANLVSLSPEIVSTGVNGVIQFTISGGTGPYTVVLDPGLGLDDHPDDGTLLFNYTAIATGFETIRVTDSLGQIAEAYVTIDSNSVLQIIPDVVEVQSGGVVLTFSASGGDDLNPYDYSIIPPKTLAGDSDINNVNGRYIPPTDSGIETVRVTDFLGATADATVHIVIEVLTINPSIDITLKVGDEWPFSASNGTLPYSFYILGANPSGSIDGVTGLFTALVKDTVTVVVEDAKGVTDTCRVKIKKP